MAENSKPLRNTDESSKALIIECLGGENTCGFDVDSIYYVEVDDEWIVIEFLKCDARRVRPCDSHPKRYWYNWRKFASLWRLVTKLEGTLYLVNYEDAGHARDQGRSEREFHVIRVDSMDPTAAGGIIKESSKTFDFAGFQKWFRGLNDRANQMVDVSQVTPQNADKP